MNDVVWAVGILVFCFGMIYGTLWFSVWLDRRLGDDFDRELSDEFRNADEYW